MKREFVVVVVAIMLTIVAAVIGVATFGNAETTIPTLIMEKPENEVYDECELHMDMYMTMPDYGDVIIKIAVSRDDESLYGNSGTAKAYSSDGEYIDELGGSIVVDLRGCETREQMIAAVREHVINYEYYERDAEEGVTYDKIYVW